MTEISWINCRDFVQIAKKNTKVKPRKIFPLYSTCTNATDSEPCAISLNVIVDSVVTTKHIHTCVDRCATMLSQFSMYCLL